MMRPQTMQHSTNSSGLADVLERVLDKGVVIAGDIKIKLVDIELLTIQIRLMIASVDKAREMGMDWWMRNSDFCLRNEGQGRGNRRAQEARAATGSGPGQRGGGPLTKARPLQTFPISELRT